MNSLETPYEKEFQSVINDSNLLYNSKLAITGNLRDSNFRSLHWKIFLKCLPTDREKWSQSTANSRVAYEELKKKSLSKLNKASIDEDNPLLNDKNNSWNRCFDYKDIKTAIEQDVIRTYPNLDFFKQPKFRNIMTSVLFTYAVINPDIAYKQGMHELLAPLIFVLYTDHQAFLSYSENNEIIYDLLILLMDPNHMEADAFTLFCRLIDVVEPWYNDRDSRCFQMPSKNKINNKETHITHTLNYITDHLLNKVDADLRNYLVFMDIPSHVYGIRWLRLLFGREFVIDELLFLWDAIFANANQFNLVNYIFITLLLYIKNALYASDYSQCMGYLMRYPGSKDVQYIINYALYLQDNKFPKPNIQFYDQDLKIAAFEPESSFTKFANYAQHLKKKITQKSHVQKSLIKSVSRESIKFDNLSKREITDLYITKCNIIDNLNMELQEMELTLSVISTKLSIIADNVINDNFNESLNNNIGTPLELIIKIKEIADKKLTKMKKNENNEMLHSSISEKTVDVTEKTNNSIKESDIESKRADSIPQPINELNIHCSVDEKSIPKHNICEHVDI